MVGALFDVEVTCGGAGGDGGVGAPGREHLQALVEGAEHEVVGVGGGAGAVDEGGAGGHDGLVLAAPVGVVLAAARRGRSEDVAVAVTPRPLVAAPPSHRGDDG